MQMEDLVSRYDIHDSLMMSVSWQPEQKVLEMIIDFCFWRQLDFDSDLPETGIVRLVFSGVTFYENPVRVYDYDSILTIHVQNKTAMFCITDGVSRKYYEILLEAESVKFTLAPEDYPEG